MNEINEITAFGTTVQLVWQPIALVTDGNKRTLCEENRFYLDVPEVAKYLVLPDTNSIVIEKASPDISFEVIATWLLGTVFAYVLQHCGYLVLHGSAIIMDGRAVIFSGDSGAGKSTLAASMVKRGYSLITDDVVVVDKSSSGRMLIIPGPAKIKLWEDALLQLNHDASGLTRILNKKNKFELPIANHGGTGIEIASFYELNAAQDTKQIECQPLHDMNKLNCLIKNTYRYNMLKPLKKSHEHLNECSKLAKQIKMYKITRPKDEYLLDELIQVIEHNKHNLIS